MLKRSHEDIKSIDQRLVQSVIEQSGKPPDNFVESATATIMWPPEGPDTERLLQSLTDELARLRVEREMGEAASNPEV